MNKSLFHKNRYIMLVEHKIKLVFRHIVMKVS